MIKGYDKRRGNMVKALQRVLTVLLFLYPAVELSRMIVIYCKTYGWVLGFVLELTFMWVCFLIGALFFWGVLGWK